MYLLFEYVLYNLYFNLQSVTDRLRQYNCKRSTILVQCAVQVSVIADVGGRSLNETVQRSMQHMPSTNLALQFNVFGRHGKRAFGTTSLFGPFS